MQANKQILGQQQFQGQQLKNQIDDHIQQQNSGIQMKLQGGGSGGSLSDSLQSKPQQSFVPAGTFQMAANGSLPQTTFSGSGNLG